MRTAILSAITAAALLATTSSADARPFRHWNGNRNLYNGVRVFPSYNSSPYYRGNYQRTWAYPRYNNYRNYYRGYYSPGFNLNFGMNNGFRYGYYYPYNGGWHW